MKNYEVIIVGGDHHNGLGLARIFGLNNVKVHSIVINDVKKSFLKYSKFVLDCVVFCDETEAFNFILDKYGNKRSDFFIIPYSDSAALELDLRFDEFRGFMIPSINEEQGRIAHLMNKSNQYAFAKRNGIRMAETITYYFDRDNDISSMKYPCIVKPVISAEGEKRDIVICDTSKSLYEKLEELSAKGYKRVLIQEYLRIDYEIDVFGCVLKQEPFICQVPTKTIRSWPVEGGTNSYSQIITDESIIKKCKAIVECIKKDGFYGLYDIELFVCGEDIILNEINYRNSGDVYMGINQNYYYPLAWTEDYVGNSYDIKMNPEYPDYTITECADLRNVLVKNITFTRWIKQFVNCKDFALWNYHDVLPALSRYFYYFKQFVRGKRL